MPARKQVPQKMILAAAMELLKSGGIDAVNVKAVARKLNCSTQPIYLSYDGIDSLRSELNTEAVNVFLHRVEDTDSRLPLCGMSYIQFAQQEPQLFRFLFMRQNAFSELGNALTPVLESSISTLMEQYKICYEDAHFFHDQLWMLAHGIASMIATGFCTWEMTKVERMLHENEQCAARKYGGTKCSATGI